MEGLLEGLQKQLQNNSITVTSACARLTAHLRQATTDDIKSLHFCLPTTLSTLLHSTTAVPSWLSRSVSKQDFESVCGLLSAEGPLFQVLMVHSHKAIYDVQVEQLPMAIRRHLVSGDRAEFTNLLVYKERLVPGNRLRLDMAEYYLFYLLHVVFMPKETRLGDAGAKWSLASFVGDTPVQSCRSVIVNDLLSLSTPGLLQCQFDNQLAAEVYLLILDSFFKYLLSTQLQPERTSVNRSPSWLRLCEFWLTMSMDMLLYNNLDTTASVNLDRVLAAQRLVEHLTVCTFVPSINGAIQSIIESVLPNYRHSLYLYITSLLKGWPMDKTMCVIMELWMTAVFPWRTVDEKWLQDVSSDLLCRHLFHLIHQPLYDFMRMSTTLFQSWIVDSDPNEIDPMALCEQSGPVIAALLDCLLNVERLLPSLRVCEQEADSTFSRSPLARQLYEQRPTISQMPVYLTSKTGQEQAATLAGLIEECRQIVNVQTMNEPMLGWAADLCRQLQTVFHFDSVIRPHTVNLSATVHDHNINGKWDVLKQNNLTLNRSSRQKGELRILVIVFEWVSTLVDTWIHCKLDQHQYIGPIIKNKHIDLRILAVPGNLLLVVFLFLLAMYMFKWMVFGF